MSCSCTMRCFLSSATIQTMHYCGWSQFAYPSKQSYGNWNIFSSRGFICSIGLAFPKASRAIRVLLVQGFVERVLSFSLLMILTGRFINMTKPGFLLAAHKTEPSEKPESHACISSHFCLNSRDDRFGCDLNAFRGSLTRTSSCWATWWQNINCSRTWSIALLEITCGQSGYLFLLVWYIFSVEGVRGPVVKCPAESCWQSLQKSLQILLLSGAMNLFQLHTCIWG